LAAAVLTGGGSCTVLDSSSAFNDDAAGVEVDAMPGGFVCSAARKTELDVNHDIAVGGPYDLP
jgi:hypothetical protein